MRITRIAILLAVISMTAFAQPAPAQTTSDWKSVEQALGRAGDRQADGAIKFGYPRSDLKVSVRGTPIAAGLALGGWVAFFGSDPDTMLMGDLVLTEEELPKVMTRLLGSPVQVTAVHNHLQNESPRVMYMHISGHGKAMELAQTVAAAMKLTGAPQPSPNASAAPKLPLDPKTLDTCFHMPGKVKGPVIMYAAPPPTEITEHGMKVANSAGLNIGINIQPVAADRVLATGDFVLLGERVNAVAKTLTDGGIQVTALHSHMLDESPRLFFMHFWADGEPSAVCTTLRKALDTAAGH